MKFKLPKKYQSMSQVIDWSDENASDKFIGELVEKVFDEKDNTLNLSLLMDGLEEGGLFKYWVNKK